jgi:hypothetical protein
MGWDGKTGKESKVKRRDGMREKGDGKECQKGIETGLEEKDWEEMGRMRKNGQRRRKKGWEDERNGMGRYVRKRDSKRLRATIGKGREGMGRDGTGWEGMRRDGKGCEEMERKGIRKDRRRGVERDARNGMLEEG